MNMIHRYIVRLVLLLCTLLFSLHSMAVCSTNTPYTATVTLQGGTFSAGEDMSTGSIIRIQQINGYRSTYTPCVGPPWLTYTATGGTLYPGQTYIYQTGISGLGVRFKNTDSGIYHGMTGRGGPWVGDVQAARFTFRAEFVKMGPISAGQVNTQLFPTLNVLANDASSVVGLPLATYRFSGGNFTVTTPTCTTPNYSYSLGTTPAADFSSSAWVDTPVTLTNCPIFSGNNSNNSYSNYTITNLNGGGSSADVGSLAPNLLRMKLTPNTTAIDATNGIVSLDANASAQGVAVQLGNKQSGTWVVQNLNNTMSISTAPGVSAASFTFPLGARMVKTNAPVVGGFVSTSLTYTISYQ